MLPNHLTRWSAAIDSLPARGRDAAGAHRRHRQPNETLMMLARSFTPPTFSKNHIAEKKDMRSSFLAPFRADRDSPTKLLFLDAAELQSSGSLAARCGGAPQSHFSLSRHSFYDYRRLLYLTTLVIGFSLLEGKGKISI